MTTSAVQRVRALSGSGLEAGASTTRAASDPSRAGRSRARGAGRASGGVRALGSGADRDPARGQVHDRGGDEEGADLARPRLEQRLVLALDGREPPDAAADVDAHLLGVLGPDLEGRVGERRVRRRHGELDEAVHLLDVLLLHPARGLEGLHLARELRRVLGGVEERDGRRSRPALLERGPRLLGACAHRRHEAHPGHDDATSFRTMHGDGLRSGSCSGLSAGRRAQFLAAACCSM